MSSGSVLLLTVLLMGYLHRTGAQPTNSLQIRCRFKPPIVDASVCEHGTFTNVCPKKDCLKGPGEVCGDSAAEIVLFGQCAHGLYCCNGQCMGCTNGNCNRDPCRPSTAHTYQLRAGPYQPDRRFDSLYSFFDYYSNE